MLRTSVGVSDIWPFFPRIRREGVSDGVTGSECEYALMDGGGAARIEEGRIESSEWKYFMSLRGEKMTARRATEAA